MKTCCTAALMALASIPGAAAAAPPSGTSPQSSSDVAAIQAMLSSYQAKLKRGDANALLSFYLDKDVPIIGVISARSYAFVSAHNPHQAIPRYQRSTAKTSVPDEIKNGNDIISDLHIDSDGSVANANWNYVLSNHAGDGRISESLIRTNDGWKITSVDFSINLANAEKADAAGIK